VAPAAESEEQSSIAKLQAFQQEQEEIP